MHVINGIVRRRSWLPALAVLAALCTSAALSLASARADGDLPDDSLPYILPPDFALELSLEERAAAFTYSDRDTVISPNSTYQIRLRFSYSGPKTSGDDGVPLKILAGSHVHADTTWAGNDGASPRLPIMPTTLNTNGFRHSDEGPHDGDPASDDYGNDVNSADDYNQISFFAGRDAEFQTHELGQSFTITATIYLAVGHRTHKAHDTASGPSDVDEHFPRSVVTLRETLDVVVGRIKELDTVSLAMANDCGEKPEHRGQQGGSQTVECWSTLPVDGKTRVAMSIRNENGVRPNPSLLSAVQVYASQGRLNPILIQQCTGGPSACSFNVSDLVGVGLTIFAGIDTITFEVDCSNPSTPCSVGTLVVGANVVDLEGNAVSDEIELNLLGPAASMEIGEAGRALTNTATPEDDHTDALQLTVSAADQLGNPVDLPRRNPRAVIKGPDGKTVAAGITTDWAEGAAFAANRGRTVVNISVTADAASPLKPGQYTLELRTAALSDSQTFAVAGPPKTVALSEPQGSLDIGSEIAFTAAVQDENGNPVADGTAVSWTDTAASADGSPVAQISRTAAVKNGEASASYLVLTEGSVYITVSSGGVNDVKLITVGATPPSPASGLYARFPGFQSYLGAAGTTAAALLADLPGFSGVLLLEAAGWLRYSISRDRVVPGSVDFNITRGDVLWLSTS